MQIKKEVCLTTRLKPFPHINTNRSQSVKLELLESSSEKIVSEKSLLYSLRLSGTKGILVSLLCLTSLFVCNICFCDFISESRGQQINGGQNHNSASFNLSHWTFFAHLNKCMLLSHSTEKRGVRCILLTLHSSVLFRRNSNSLVHFW